MYLAIIDIGSRSMVLEIFKIDGDSYKTVRTASVSTALSKNRSFDNKLAATAIGRSVDALASFTSIIAEYKDCYSFAVCTEAVRSAANQDEFLSYARQVLPQNCILEVISGEKEAYYTYLGIVNTTALRDFVYVDTGGASTELGLVKDRNLIGVASVPHGAISLTERFFPREIAQKHQMEEAEAFFISQMDNIPWIGEATGFPIIGAGNAIRNLTRLEMSKKLSETEHLHGYMLFSANVNFLTDRMAKLTPEQRQAELGIGAKISEYIIGGVTPLKAVFAAIDSKRMYFSNYSLRMGVFFEKFAISRHRHTAVESDVLGISIRRLQEHYGADVEHAANVENMAYDVFAQTENLHNFPERYGRILGVASRLHDVGDYVAHHNHHEHSFYLIKESNIFGLDMWDTFYSAVIAGLHRREKLRLQTNIWESFKYRKMLDKQTFAKLKELGTMLAIAERMAGRYPKLSALKVNVAGDMIQIMPHTIDKRKKIDNNEFAQVPFERRLLGKKVILG